MNAEIPKDLPAGMTAFPASDTRPEGFPPDLPFVPGVACLVGEGAASAGDVVLTCSWLAAEDGPAGGWKDRARSLADAASGIPLVSSLLAAADRLRGRDAETARGEVERVVAAAPAGERAVVDDLARSTGEAMRPAPATEDGVGRVARAVLAASRADGWAVESDRTVPFPGRTRIVTLRREGRMRAVTSMAAAFGGQVMLSETAARDG